MIKTIKKTIKGNVLTVEVECHIRNFASHKILLLTTDKIIDILLKDNITIKETIKEPHAKVGNSNVKKVTSKGTWVFEIEENKSEKKEKNTTTTRTRKPTTRTKKTKSSSIRERMSKIATKED